jgi:LmbE family N-acetylglucosaminyl deacetylase
MVVAPHPDDEALGCGGLLLRRKSEGSRLAWVIATRMANHSPSNQKELSTRSSEIGQVSKKFGFDEVYQLDFETTKLDSTPMTVLVKEISKLIDSFQPTEILIPHHGDVHSDHRVVSEATLSSVKWFRSPSISRVLSYETLSETNFNLVRANQFSPNFYVDISEFISEKIQIINLYRSEMGEHPFPRSSTAVESLAKLRGSACGFQSAEAFELLYERV